MTTTAEWAQLFVTGAVGVLGFLGVMYTLKKNTELNQTHSDHLRSQDQLALRIALQTELSETKRIYLDRAKRFREDHKPGTAGWIPDFVLDKIYDNSAGQLGLLTKPEIELLVSTYALVSELPSRLLLLPSDVPPDDRQVPRLPIY